MPCKVDLHTHSIASPDGSLTTKNYARALEQSELQAIAVTDHNTVEMALEIQQALGDAIIVGEEITTTEGEIIGLYLHTTIRPMLTPEETVAAIKEQGGLVYVPHPFETVRKGIPEVTLDRIAKDVDIIEVHNGRAVFQNRSRDAVAWSERHHVPGAASSDSHGIAGWGRTYSEISQLPTRDTLVSLLAEATYAHASPGLRGILYPKYNRLRKNWRKHD